MPHLGTRMDIAAKMRRAATCFLDDRLPTKTVARWYGISVSGLRDAVERLRAERDAAASEQRACECSLPPRDLE